jgi:amino acid permease
MSSKNKPSEKIGLEQHELLENAQQRINQKKRLYYHFVIFLVGSIFLIILNKILGYGESYDWFVWAIVFWAFLFIIHLINVFVTHKFMGKEWERSQREKLVKKQEEKITSLALEIEKQRSEDNSKNNTL